jgi:L-ascorbate metabolism protein UlaG (beta-lactamase superfamily)
MELQFYGANCLRISAKKATLVADDNLSELGLKPVIRAGEIAVYTGAHGDPQAETEMVIDQPGEYEMADVSVQGIAARSHLEEAGGQSATMYKILADDIRIAIVGHIYPELNDGQLEALGTVDVLIIPVGGGGYTLDATGALDLIKKIEPKIVIPTHYGDKDINFPVPQRTLEDVLKELAMEPSATVPKLKVKPADLTDDTRLVILERQ